MKNIENINKEIVDKIRETKKMNPQTTIEVLTPDFLNY